MKASSKWIGIGLFVVLLMVARAVLSRSHEPRHQGKTVTEWLDVLSGARGRRASGGERERQALTAIQAIGTNAVAVLFRHLDGEPDQPRFIRIWEKMRGELGSFGAKLPTMSTEGDPEAFELSYRRKSAAATALLALGIQDGSGGARLFAWAATNSTDGISQVIDAMRRASLTEAKLREELITRLSDPAVGVRRIAMGVIAFSGPEFERAFPAVTNCLSDADGPVKYWAVFATRATGRNHPEIVVPILINLLTNAAAGNQRAAAASMLADFGTNAVPALPALERAVSDPDPSVARKARSALNGVRKAAGFRDNPASR